ncbi:MAG: hypothetical protein WBQ08_04960 [Candidatus Sulfotelmatobacter sp.]
MPTPEDERRTDKRPNVAPLNDERFDDEPIDEKFEAYLKQFRPLAPQPLPVESRVHEPRRWFVPAAWAASAALVAVALLAFHARRGEPRIPPRVESFAIVDRLAKPQSLTIRSANALLATAPSFKDAIDGIAFPPKPAPLPADRRSALTELSKEKIKL